MAAIGGNLNTMRRQLKNVVGNYSIAQIKVREATSNDPWGPSSTLMSNISDLTYNPATCTEVMHMIWKRLNDHGKNWRHVYKSLVVLDYLVKLGSEQVVRQCRENVFTIQTLKDFQHVEDNKDQGINVRERAKQLVLLLKDEDRLNAERDKAMTAQQRFELNSVAPYGKTRRIKKSETFDPESMTKGAGKTTRIRRSSELDECRPGSIGEEELQLQIALAISQEEAAREEELRKSDSFRLQMALNVSQNATESGSPSSSDLPGPSKTYNDDDPWSTVAVATTTTAIYNDNDPWMSVFPDTKNKVPSQRSDPWAPQKIPEQDFPTTNGNQATTFLDEFDPFSDKPVSPVTTNSNQQQQQKRRASRDPAEFLGQNSALVNLDNLLGMPVASMPPTQPINTGGSATRTYTSTNPFLTGPNFHASTSNAVYQAFSYTPSPAAYRHPASALPIDNYHQIAASAGRPIIPQRPASTNPFL